MLLVIINNNSLHLYSAFLCTQSALHREGNLLNLVAVAAIILFVCLCYIYDDDSNNVIIIFCNNNYCQ